MKTLWRRGLEAALGLGGLAGVVVWLSGGCHERIAPLTSPPTAVEQAGPALATLELVRVPVREWASGSVASARRTVVSSRVLARIEEVRVRAGSAVHRGDVLIRLDARDLEARLQQVREALRGARARLELARTERERVRKLVSEGVATRERLDRSESAYRVAEAEVARLTQGLDEARASLSHAVLRAPVDGRVIDRLAEPGDTAVPGRPLLRIYDPSVLRVEVPVRETLALRRRVGEPLEVEVPAAAGRLQGIIDEIVPFADPGARTLLLKVRLPPREGLLAGLFARVAIPAGEREILLAPASAVERIGQLEYARALGPGGRPERRVVTTAPSEDPERVEVLSGLEAGERILARR